MPTGVIESEIGWEGIASGRDIYWEPDSHHFWVVKAQTASSYPIILQVNTDTGTIVREIVLQDGLPDAGDMPFSMSELSPINHIALVDGASLCVYDFEAGDDIDCSVVGDWGWSLSPNGQEIAKARQKIITSLDGTPISTITPATTWTESPDLVWGEGFSWIYPYWSPNGEMIATRRILNDSALTIVYFKATLEVRLLAVDDLGSGTLIWSPDSQALAQVLYYESNRASTLSIVTLDGNVLPVFTGFSDETTEQRRVTSVTWIPHGWLQVDG